MRPVLDVPPGYRGLALRTPTLPPATHTNCYVVGARGALIVDPGSPYRGEQALLQELLYRLRGEGGDLAAVLLTHHHPDHVGGAVAVARRFDLPLYAQERTFACLDASGGAGRAGAGRAGAGRDAWRQLPRRRLVEGDVLVVDERRELEVLHTPGHAVGHLCLLERTPGPGQGTLLAGDMIPGLGTTLIDPDEGSMAVYLRELRRLAARAPRWVLPSHGPVLEPAVPAIDQLVAHREQRELRVEAALRDRGPRSLAAVAAEAYAELPVTATPLTRRSTLAHLLKLRDEGRVRQLDDDQWSRDG